ncbi:MAG: hypothetical protein IKQ55_02400 [Kiritimatiellae bacterium]|nr:hypothetical protein [Kiritimatiellia bacterium]
MNSSQILICATRAIPAIPAIQAIHALLGAATGSAGGPHASLFTFRPQGHRLWKQKGQNGQQNNRRIKPSDNPRQLFEETTWTTRDNSFEVPGGQLRPAADSEWD